MPSACFGIAAEFATPAAVQTAARSARAAGYRHVEAYSPFPVPGLADDLDPRPTHTSVIMALGGLTGGVGAFLMMTYANVWAYRFNVGGRPPFSWVAYIPITFELTVLGAALAGVTALFAISRLPEPYHPLFNVPAFLTASTDRFFLCIAATDPRFDPQEVTTFLHSLQPVAVQVVPT